MTNASMQDGFDTDVIIIGAGPIGLTAAAALAHHGIKFRLFASSGSIQSHTRAPTTSGTSAGASGQHRHP